MRYDKLYINGEWKKSYLDEFIEVENPADKSIIAKVPAADKLDVELAILAAKNAFRFWKNISLEERIEYINKMIDYFEKTEEKIAETIHKELGCTLKFAKIGHVNGYINEMKEIIEISREYSFEIDYEGYKVYKEPVGVIGCITPWNYPFGQISKKVIPAILIGNTVVLKPSERTPLTAYHFARAAEYAELPAGVFNLVTGNGCSVGSILTKSEDVNMITFTGSTHSGKIVAKEALDTVKRLALELGGKSSVIILEGADLDYAIKRTLTTLFYNVGQTCSAETRMIVPRSLAKEFEEKVKEQTKTYIFGDPRKEGVKIGPLQSKKQFDKVKEYIEIGIKEGATLLLGEVPKESYGYYVNPVVFTDVDSNMIIAQEEIFGPVLCIIYYDTLEEAIEISNDTIYGLAGSVYGPEEKALEVSKEMEAGQININRGKYYFNAPFGGFKQSGLGREGGIHGLREFLEIKTIFK